MIRKLLLFASFFIFTVQAQGQDTLVLLNGRVIPVLSVDFQEYRVAYRKLPKQSKQISESQTTESGSIKKKKTKYKTMDPLRIFSVKYSDGTERVVYRPDSLDPMEFSQDQMRLFIKGEQDADKYYKNNFNKGLGFSLGAGAGLLGFYGLAVPPLYATIMGSFTPNLSNRLKRQNKLQETKTILDAMSVPVLPSAGSSPETLAAYEESKSKYDAAVKKHEKALKCHQKNIAFSDPDLLARNEYREGYERKARDRKIRNAMLSGLAGFVMLVVGLPIIY
ncbi:MAG: hypothetical protein EYC69_04705 [Bacteroidetes bacterium]|nr:MAG: hypothetical protein EYC69_04705 [Bacteroidota bacterium]